jgi:DNA-binding CsgD family transcriptional regulator
MLSNVAPSSMRCNHHNILPEFLRHLVTSLDRGKDVDSAIIAIVRRLGFENLLYGASASPKLDHESKSYVFTTLSREWVALYEQQAYIEVDPRLSRALDSALPVIWDHDSEYGQSARIDTFLDDSLKHGVGSGVVVGIHGSHSVRVIVALSSRSRQISASERASVTNHLGEIVLFAIYFHELFMKSVIARGIAPESQGSPLSPRELQCIGLAARGQTSRDIAFKLGISERTIQFHFDSIRSKLGAANRQEAVAKAIADKLILQ